MRTGIARDQEMNGLGHKPAHCLATTAQLAWFNSHFRSSIHVPLQIPNILSTKNKNMIKHVFSTVAS